MQELCEDYSDKEGCCLKCSTAYPNCLCYECKCKQCYWYISPEEWNNERGRCGLILKRKKQKLNELNNYFKKTSINYNIQPKNKNQKTLFPPHKDVAPKDLNS